MVSLSVGKPTNLNGEKRVRELGRGVSSFSTVEQLCSAIKWSRGKKPTLFLDPGDLFRIWATSRRGRSVLRSF